MIYKHVPGLFHRAISQSGTALSPWGYIEHPVEQALEFAEGVDCPIEDNVIMLKCLKALPAMRIARYHIGYIVGFGILDSWKSAKIFSRMKLKSTYNVS